VRLNSGVATAPVLVVHRPVQIGACTVDNSVWSQRAVSRTVIAANRTWKMLFSYSRGALSRASTACVLLLLIGAHAALVAGLTNSTSAAAGSESAESSEATQSAVVGSGAAAQSSVTKPAAAAAKPSANAAVSEASESAESSKPMSAELLPASTRKSLSAQLKRLDAQIQAMSSINAGPESLRKAQAQSERAAAAAEKAHPKREAKWLIRKEVLPVPLCDNCVKDVAPSLLVPTKDLSKKAPPKKQVMSELPWG